MERHYDRHDFTAPRGQVQRLFRPYPNPYPEVKAAALGGRLDSYLFDFMVGAK